MLPPRESFRAQLAALAAAARLHSRCPVCDDRPRVVEADVHLTSQGEEIRVAVDCHGVRMAKALPEGRWRGVGGGPEEVARFVGEAVREGCEAMATWGDRPLPEQPVRL